MIKLTERTLLGSLVFVVIKDDILNLEVDAYVCPSNSSFSLDGLVAKSLIQKAGQQLVNNVSAQFKSQKLDTSKAKLLRCQWLPNANSIIFVNGPLWDAKKANQCKTVMRNTVRNALLEAEAENLESIAIPLIGSGKAGFPRDVAAEALQTGVKSYFDDLSANLESIKKGESSFRRIFFVLFDEEAREAFKKCSMGWLKF